jgi:hypothetical protein
LESRRGKQAWADVLQNSQFDFPPDGEPFISENYMLAIDDDDDRLTDSVADNLKNGTDVVISLLEASQVDDVHCF